MSAVLETQMEKVQHRALNYARNDFNVPYGELRDSCMSKLTLLYIQRRIAILIAT